eukprot:6195878-Alexandrium_andersonii.AAC.1
MELPRCSPDSEGEEASLRGFPFGVIPGKVKKELVCVIEKLIQVDVEEHGGPGIAEFFSPPRVSPGAGRYGFRDEGAYDLVTGWDGDTPEGREMQKELLNVRRPFLGI